MNKQEIEYQIFSEQAIECMAVLNAKFAKKDTMTLKEFMDIQQKVWKGIKKKYGLNFT